MEEKKQKALPADDAADAAPICPVFRSTTKKEHNQETAKKKGIPVTAMIFFTFPPSYSRFCLWRSPDLGMVSVVVVVVVVVLLVGATFVLSDLCTIQKNL